MRLTIQFLTILSVAFAAATWATLGLSDDAMFAQGVVSDSGEIRVPENFRSEYVMLGAWSVAGDVDTGAETGLHTVYSPRSVVDAYRETGQFPDGAVLVKELLNGKTESLTTGEATSAASTAGYFVMVKDAQGRFRDNPLWGDGWGWSFFAADDTQNTKSTDYVADCLSCHEPVRASDLVYSYAYPVLSR